MLNKGKHGAVGQEQARGGRKGSLNGRVIDRGHGICPKSALGAARAAMLSTAHPLLPDTTCATEGSAEHPSRKRHGGERGPPQPEAYNLEHLRQPQAQAERCVALCSNWAGDPPQGLALAGCLASLGAHMPSPGRARARASITPLPALERCAGAEHQQIAGAHAMHGSKNESVP